MTTRGKQYPTENRKSRCENSCLFHCAINHGEIPSASSELIHCALIKLSRWASSNGLETNPTITELVLDQFIRPVLDGVALKVSCDAKYLRTARRFCWVPGHCNIDAK